MRSASVYVHCAADGTVLYVGMTCQGHRRQRDHAGQAWWRQVARTDWEHFPSQAEARRREREVIASLQPVHNTIRPLSVELAELVEDGRIYGVADLARLLGADRRTVAKWVARGHIPPPTERLALGPVWLAEDLKADARR